MDGQDPFYSYVGVRKRKEKENYDEDEDEDEDYEEDTIKKTTVGR
jgi:hypothetical protein